MTEFRPILRQWNHVELVESSDTNVFKLVFTKEDAVAEAVLYRYGSFRERTVICTSTQSGCPMGCRFCGAGEYFNRSLTSEEIVEQSVIAMALAYCLEGVTSDTEIERMQIMFMSMGEPGLNQKNLAAAIRKLHSIWPTSYLLISTSAPRVSYDEIFEVSKEIDKVGLQFSVHESTDEARNKLIPIKGKMNLNQIRDTGNAWAMVTGRTPFFNYCVHPENNKEADADRIYNLFSPTVWQATISVICEREESVAAANVRQRQLATDFEQKLLERGFSTRTFDPAGQDDIGGGCGQLWFVQKWLRENPKYAKRTCGTGLPTVHTPRVQYDHHNEPY